MQNLKLEIVLTFSVEPCVAVFVVNMTYTIYGMSVNFKQNSFKGTQFTMKLRKRPIYFAKGKVPYL